MPKRFKDIHDQRLNRLNTRPIFPKIYNGFREIDAISEGENSILQVLKDCAERASKDKLLTRPYGEFVNIISEERLKEWEEELSIQVQEGATIEQRQGAVCDYISRSRVINDDYLQRLVDLAVGEDKYIVRSDSDRLTLTISTPPNIEDEGTPEDLSNAIDVVLPVAPQNLSVSGGVSFELFKSFIANFVYETAVKTGLGYVEWTPAPPAENMIYGIMQEGEGDDVQLTTPNDVMNNDQEMVEILGETGIIPAPTYYIYLAFVGYKSVSGVGALRAADPSLGLSQAKSISDGVYERKEPYMIRATRDENDAISAMDVINAVPGYYAVIRTVNVSPDVVVQRVYSRSAAYQNLNLSTASGAEVFTYREGENTTADSYSSTLKVLSLRSNNGAELELKSEYLLRVVSNKIKFYNGFTSSINWCYVEFVKI